MAKTAMKQTFDLELKDKWTKANCEVTLAVDGKTVPNAEIMGRALEAAVALIQERIAASYTEVPPRPVAPATATEKPAQTTRPAVTATLPLNRY
jgi:hypothetical protein